MSATSGIQRTSRAVLARIDDLLDVSLLGLAAWTVAFHASLALGGGLAWIAGGAALGWGTLILWWWRLEHAVRGPTSDGESSPARPATVIVALAALAAAAAACVRRPDADDIAYLSWANWVAERGFVPVRDVVISDHLLNSSAPRASFAWETLLGAVGRIGHAQPGSLAYLVAAPAVAALAIAAASRLQRAWHIELPSIAIVVTTLYLFAGGASSASFGTFALARGWQGKSLLVVLILPLLLSALTTWLRDADRRGLLAAACCVVAAVGVSATTYLVVPVVVLASIFAAILVTPTRAVARRCAAASTTLAYPALVYAASTHSGDVTAHGPSVSPDVLRALPVLHLVLGTGVLLVVTMVLAATSLVATPDRLVRATLLTTSGACGVLLLGPIQRDLHDRTGAGSIFWRLLWIVPIPVLVGAGVSGIAALAMACVDRRHVRTIVGTALGVACGGLLVLVGTPPWSARDATLVGPGWKVDPHALEAARVLSTAPGTQRGDLVAAPDDVAAALDITSARVHPATTRADYLATYRDAQLTERLVGRSVAQGQTADLDPAKAETAFVALGIHAACVRGGGVPFLRSIGWTSYAVLDGCTIMVR